MQSKFIQPGRSRPAPRTPATPQQGQQNSAPRPIVEELGTQQFEFPRERGTRPDALPPQTPPAARTQSPLTPTAPPSAPASKVNEKTYAETDPNFFSIHLPSGFMFNDFDSLSCRTLMAAHQAKFSRANKEQKLRYSVEAISATLEPGLSAFDLTPADFYFLMYWQKVNSFSKNPMLITAYCDDVDHNHAVHIGIEVPDEDDPENPEKTKLVKKDEDTLRTEVVLSNTTLDVKYLEGLDVSDLDVVRKYDLHVETMRDIVEVTEYIEENTVSEEDLFMLQYAVLLRRKEGLNTVKERLKFATENFDTNDTAELETYIKRVTAYGVSEYANIKCKECGASQRVKISFDALTFLPGS
jgi:hypothetical protein